MVLELKKGEQTVEIDASVPTTYTIAYWYEKDQEIPEHEEEHIKDLLEQGYTSGELLYDHDHNYNRGWWRIIGQEKI